MSSQYLSEQHQLPESLSALQILEKAADILTLLFQNRDAYTEPDVVKRFLCCKLAKHEREVFAVMFLDSKHQLIHYQELFQGTIDAAIVYPREVVKAALAYNAAAVIFAHNHPSGVADASASDKRITRRLVDALALVDIRVLDHIIVGEHCSSFAELGLL